MKLVIRTYPTFQTIMEIINFYDHVQIRTTLLTNKNFQKTQAFLGEEICMIFFASTRYYIIPQAFKLS